MPDEVQLVRRRFGAVERRDRELLACYAEDVEITEAQLCRTAAPIAAATVTWRMRWGFWPPGARTTGPMRSSSIRRSGATAPSGR